MVKSLNPLQFNVRTMYSYKLAHDYCFHRIFSDATNYFADIRRCGQFEQLWPLQESVQRQAEESKRLWYSRNLLHCTRIQVTIWAISIATGPFHMISLYFFGIIIIRIPSVDSIWIFWTFDCSFSLVIEMHHFLIGNECGFHRRFNFLYRQIPSRVSIQKGNNELFSSL